MRRLGPVLTKLTVTQPDSNPGHKILSIESRLPPVKSRNTTGNDTKKTRRLDVCHKCSPVQNTGPDCHPQYKRPIVLTAQTVDSCVTYSLTVVMYLIDDLQMDYGNSDKRSDGTRDRLTDQPDIKRERGAA